LYHTTVTAKPRNNNTEE